MNVNEMSNVVDAELVEYVEREIIPRYDNFDKAHRRDHVKSVIDRSLAIASHMPYLDIDMVYCVAAFHDLGLTNGRELHHEYSAEILSKDSFIRNYFDDRQIEIMKQAVADHRASGKCRPRNDYGLVVADADRLIDPETIIRRTIQYGLSNYPQLDHKGHYARTLHHLKEKYGSQGYLRVWLPWSDNVARLEELHRIIADPEKLGYIFDRIFKEETR